MPDLGQAFYLILTYSGCALTAIGAILFEIGRTR